jgi:hypothetical protein
MYNDNPDYQDPEEDPKPKPQDPSQDPAQPVQPTTAPITTQPVAAPVTATDPAAAIQAKTAQMQPELAGWDSVKSGNLDRAWTDFVTSKYGQAGRGAGFANLPAGGVQQAVNDFNTSTGAKASVVSSPSGDMIDFHDGRGPVDVKTASGDLWNERLGGNNGMPGGAAGIAGGMAGAGGMSAGGANNGFPDFSRLFASQTSGGVNDPRAGALFDMLMAKAKQSESIDPNDPTIRTQADNFSAAQTRGGRRYLQELAESKGAGANIGAEARMVAEKGAQASASNEGAIMQHELDSRRQEIMQALSQAGQFMTAQQQMSLQAELASLNAQTQKYGMDLSNGQYYAGLGSQNRQFDNNLAQRAYEYDTTDNYNRTRVK